MTIAVAVHRFDSTGEAYDASQTDDRIASGDVLVVEREQAVAVLIEAWPVAVGKNVGEFHAPGDDFSWSAVQDSVGGPPMDYSKSYEIARAEVGRWEAADGS